MVNDGSLTYFKSKGFSTVHLIVPDKGTYQAELSKIKALGMHPIIDIEIPIWNGGQYQSTPISSYASYFQSLKAAGWQYVSSEGGRTGDASYLVPTYFKGYVNYNCDQCGLWKANLHTDPCTVSNSWESYYTSQWPSIQQGVQQARDKGVKNNGLLAGVWEGTANPILTNSKNGGSPSYQSMLDWSYANGCGFTHFHVWCAYASGGLNKYKALGFEDVIAKLQVKYPPTKSPELLSSPTTESPELPSSSTTESPEAFSAMASAPAAVSSAQGRLDVFAKGTNGNLYHRSFQNKWSNWENFGKPSSTITVASAPAAVSSAQGRLDVFVRGSDGQLWQLSYANGRHWSSQGMPAGITIAQNTAPAAASWGSSRLDVFVLGTDGQLWQKYYQNGWHWTAIGKPTKGLQGSPGALATNTWGYPRIDVFIRGADGALYQKWYNGRWQPWQFAETAGRVAQSSGNAKYGTSLYSPAAVSSGKNRLDVFYIDTNGRLQQKHWDGSWKSSTISGSQYPSASPSAVISTYGTPRIDVFIRGADGALWQTYYQSQWAGWKSLGGITAK